MSGNRYLLDTNAVIALLRGNKSLLRRLQDAEWLGISVLSQIEFLAFPQLSDRDRHYFDQFLERVVVIGLDSTQTALIDRIIALRQHQPLKLPDAIIAATALHSSATLVTDDQKLSKIPRLTTISSK